jgi:Xaa-Pro aminopeptidase
MAFLDPHTPAPSIPARVYAQRRLALAQKMGAGSVAIIPTAPEQIRNRDAHFAYRADSYFYYLTGFEEAQAYLVLEGGTGRATLFCLAKDLTREIWDGYRLGPEAAPAALGVDAAFGVDELGSKMPELLANQHALYYPFASQAVLGAPIEQWLAALRGQARSGVRCPQALHDATALLDELRLIKDAEEIGLMRHAGGISAAGHIRGMQTSARMLRAGQDAREFHLEAELLHAFRQAGSAAPAYTSIVAAGANACVLHYRAGNAPLKAGELVLIDAACEWQNYASDITRTFPADGRFTPAQRAVYEVVLAAQEAAIAATRPGVSFDSVHQAALVVLVQGLFDLKILNAQAHGSVQDAIANKAYAPYYMHRTSHWLGLDVHDAGSYVEADGSSRILQPGMALTIEPGLYLRPCAEVPEALHQIGIRIEDDAVVTASGCELLTRAVPVAADEIERLMCHV